MTDLHCTCCTCNCIFEVIRIIFLAFQNHNGEQYTSEVCQLKEIIHYLLVLIYRPFLKKIYIGNDNKMNIYRLILIWSNIYTQSFHQTFANSIAKLCGLNDSSPPVVRCIVSILHHIWT